MSDTIEQMKAKLASAKEFSVLEARRERSIETAIAKRNKDYDLKVVKLLESKPGLAETLGDILCEEPAFQRFLARQAEPIDLVDSDLDSSEG